MTSSVQFASLEVGDSIPALTKPAITRIQLALFAGAACDHNPIHVDDEIAKASGLPGVIAHGMLNMAYLGQLLTNWVPQKNIRKLSARFVAMAFPGDVITCTGKVIAKSAEEGENRVELELAVENQRGEKIQMGKATVVVLS